MPLLAHARQFALFTSLQVTSDMDQKTAINNWFPVGLGGYLRAKSSE
jgi:hypothetical protein